MANRKRTTLGVVHVTATPPGWDKAAAGIRAIHKTQGWSDIGYNEIINPDGRPEMGRGKMAIGAHVAGFNSISYGLSMVRGITATGRPDFNTIKDAQLTTLEKRMRELTVDFPEIEWCGHRDLSPDKNGNGIIEPFEYMKACPCFDVHPLGSGARSASRGNQGHMEAPRAGAAERACPRRPRHPHGLPAAPVDVWRLCAGTDRRHYWQEDPRGSESLPACLRASRKW
nr:N-acetylmuramoyl-L-alanine amidase [Rhizobium sp. Leaf453]